ncbi:hypothetical protein EBT31_12465 [bacterium]|nr:hypothetical protein [bacterium]NBX48708.1 hypothetical protein [bacterium]
MQTINKLIDREQKLKEQLKEVREELKEEVEKTEMFKAFLQAINETADNKISGKAAVANAYKLTLNMLANKE